PASFCVVVPLSCRECFHSTTGLMRSFSVFLFVDCVTQESQRVRHIEALRRSAGSQVSAANRRDILIRRTYEHPMRATEICSLQSKTWAYCRPAGIPIHLSHPLTARAGRRAQR